MEFNLKDIEIGYSKSQTLFKIKRIELPENGLILLAGMNGQGKSTFFKTLLGLIKPLKGDIKLNNDISLSGMLTNSEVNEFIEVNDLLYIARTPYLNWLGKHSKEDDEIVRFYLNYFKIEHLLNKRFSELSDGQKQRVLLARTFVQDTNIVLLDEPSNYLDYWSKRELVPQLEELSKQKLIIISTHHFELFEKVVQEVLFIENQQMNLHSAPQFYSKVYK